MHITRNRVVFGTLAALLLSTLACNKAQPQPTAAEPELVAKPSTAGNVVIAPGLPGTAAQAVTATTTHQYVHPLEPTAKEVEENQAKAEAYYRSPQGASGPGTQPSPGR